ncbi:hypothetical protein BDW59DRAFT_153767 [Aspergillus cavernicola]|uniref:Integral membrane protein n=1 Tax=Aspergillus cavernicola TaxID=176166 RepID=A0ABR4HJH6_9EURO
MASGISGSGTLVFRRTPTATISLSTLFFLTLAFSTSILAQDVSLRPSAASATFPACGLTCTQLTQADDGCTPPTVQVTNRQTYVSCFCQSDLLRNFQTTADGTCDETCTTPADRQLLQQWYVNFCNSGGNTGNSGTNTDSDEDTEDNTNSNTTSPADSSASPVAGSRNPAPQSWLDGHYQWIIMIVILVVGFAALAVLGVWLKRRHDAKHPHLYHAATGGSDSRIFANRNLDSPSPGPAPSAIAAHSHESANTVSIASSSRTDDFPPSFRPAQPSRLQKVSQSEGNTAIQEALR